jgi:hypothetical protein
MSFATQDLRGKDMHARRVSDTNAYAPTTPGYNYPTTAVSFPSLETPNSTANVLRAKPFFLPTSGTGIRILQPTHAPAVNFQVNNPDDLANMLFPGNTNVNMTHVHEGLLSHTDAIHELAKTIHGNRTTDSKMQQMLHSKMEDQNAFNHEVFGNHTTALQMMQATHAEVDGGLRNHQKHIEDTLKGLSTQSEMLGENIRRMQSLKADTEREHEIHKSALANHTMVLKSNVAELGLLRNDRGTYDEALKNHKLAIEGTAGEMAGMLKTNARFQTSVQDSINEQRAATSRMQKTWDETHAGHSRSMEDSNRRLGIAEGEAMQTKISFDAGLRHHTDMIGQSFGRINGLESVATNMSSSLKGLQRGHDLTTQRITELEKSLSGGPTSKSMQVELDRIKMAVNENAGLLDHLLTHLDATQNAPPNASNASMQNMLSNPPRR